MFKLIHKTAPKTAYESHKETFLIGRSEECEIVLKDPHVSRNQAEVRIENGRYVIENLGRNPIFVNGASIQSQILNDGDEIKFGKTDLLFQEARSDAKIAEKPSFSAKTVVLTSPQELTSGPRLVCTTPSGDSKIYPLDKEKILIGRSPETDIQLQDPSVSREHGQIEKKDDCYVAVSFSETNPLLLNAQAISEARIYSGAQLSLGSFVLTFISERPEDQQPAAKEMVGESKRSEWILGLAAACLLLSFGSYMAYIHIYRPWRVDRTLTSVSKKISAGNPQTALDTLKSLLESDLSHGQTHKTKELLSQTVLAITQKMAGDGKLEEAKEYLMAHLKHYGTGEEADVLWDQLDFYRLNIGNYLESLEEYRTALRQYSAVREDSPYFEEAQTSIRRIWLAYQQQQRKDQTLSQLLKEAETHFFAKRYLTPVNQNAYSVYQAVLALEPENKLALKRIDQMKEFYRVHGEQRFDQKNWSRALTYFERYNLIDPESIEIKEKIRVCRQNMALTGTHSGNSAPGHSAPNKKREQIKRLLEESGAESSWIMEYLFEEKSGEKDSETPW
ncbi:MAG: FHA domain-containing protein [Candidatus Aminicenantes bacterium]|nr:MAG: FHA domain-containing protein [Candidatus Aminicenantes bacterium]